MTSSKTQEVALTTSLQFAITRNALERFLERSCSSFYERR